MSVLRVSALSMRRNDEAENCSDLFRKHNPSDEIMDIPNMPTAKIGETLQAIDENWLSGNQGLLYRRQIRDALGELSQAQKNEIEKAINLEEPQGTLLTIVSKFRPRVQPTREQTRKTLAIRAFLLASFTVRRIPISRKGYLLTQVEALSTSQIVQRLIMIFPLVTSNNKRDQWGPEHFSVPATHAGNRFRLFMHCRILWKMLRTKFRSTIFFRILPRSCSVEWQSAALLLIRIIVRLIEIMDWSCVYQKRIF
jgi:hypothetical protein